MTDTIPRFKRRKHPDMSVLLHIGSPKTATTSLQQFAFNSANGFYPLGRFGAGHGECASELLNELIREGLFLHEADWERRKQDYAEEVTNHLEKAVDQGLRPVLSQEGILGRAGHGAVSERLRRLKWLFGDEAEVVMVIREQLALLKSYYSTCVFDMGLSLSFEEYLGRSISYPTWPINKMPFLDFHQVHRTIKGEFSQSTVFVFESLFEGTTAQAFQTLFNLNLSDVPKSNPSRSKRQINVMRSFNRAFPRGYSAAEESPPSKRWYPENQRLLERASGESSSLNSEESERLQTCNLNYLGRSLGADTDSAVRILATARKPVFQGDPFRISDALENQIKDYYRTGNAQLSESLDLNLAAYGY